MKRYLLLALAVLATVGFCALGVWQLERREWKLALIDRVERRIHAEPVAPPGPADWTKVNRESSEYLRVTATGHFLPGRETRVYATTALGGGFWVMAPFQTDAGFIVLVNRGFVPLGSQSSVTGDTLGAACARRHHRQRGEDGCERAFSLGCEPALSLGCGHALHRRGR
jgi:surfeit locus 1 family protein